MSFRGYVTRREFLRAAGWLGLYLWILNVGGSGVNMTW